MKNKKILLLRHGETNWNIQQRFQGSHDIPLNENGEEQARAVASRISAWCPEIVWASPLQRALRTAVIASGYPIDEISVLPELREINFGAWEGRAVSELKAEGDLFARWAQMPFKVPVPNAETEDQILERASQVLELLQQCEAEKILVVSHGGTLRALLAAALQIPFQSAWKYFRLSNCSLTGLEYSGEKFVLAFYNDHLILPKADCSESAAVLPIVF